MKTVAILALLLGSLPIIMTPLAQPETIEPLLKDVPSKPVEIFTGVRLQGLEKVDPASNIYHIDFYIWFTFDPSKISKPEVADFEFLNGKPSVELVSSTDPDFLEYRVVGDFVGSFDVRSYPFDSYTLTTKVEHKNMNASYIVYTVDQDTRFDPDFKSVGWGASDLKAGVHNHTMADDVTEMSNFVFTIQVTRPTLNSMIKYVLPITVITLISLSAFFIEPTQFGQRITIIVTTLISASATHLGIMNGLPPTTYLTIIDRIMFIVYIVFLWNLAATIYLMRLVNQSKFEEAGLANRRAFRLLFLLFGALVAVQFVI